MEGALRLLLFIVMSSSTAEEVAQHLRGVVGGNVTLPDPLVESGFILFERLTLAMVKNREYKIEEDKYKNKLHWDKNSGYVTITDLQRNDSGIYSIDSKKGHVFNKPYKLKVYESVSSPAVRAWSVSAERCILLCSVEEGEDTTLWWYRGEDQLNQSSSALSLPLTVHLQDFSSPHSCVAANPVENKTLMVNVTTSCRISDTKSSDAKHRYYTGTIIPIMCAALVVTAVTIIIIIKRKWCTITETATRQSPDSGNSEPAIDYSDIQILEDRCRKWRKGPDPSESSNLTTVYSEVKVAPMSQVSADTSGKV
ncbi:CD48 antigen-like [Aulostomus maculatus]